MTAPMYVAPTQIQMPDAPVSAAVAELADLMRQTLDVQREQLALLKAQMAAQDQASRWRAFLGRWSDEFPEVGGHCKQVLPALERAYLALVKETTDRLRAESPDDLDNEFVLGEFLDRYGLRLGQLGNILSQIGPLAEAAS